MDNAPEVATKVAIVVVSYNALDYAKKMLASVRRTRGVDYEIVVVDNNSSRATKLWWTAQRFRGRINRLALLDRNTFFAEGCNIGVAMAPRDATHVLLLNTDCEVLDPDWLTRMLAAHEEGATGLRYITGGAWSRADGFCFLVDRHVWGAGLDETYQWWWSVTGLEARLLREGYRVAAVRDYEDVLVHHGGKSGKAYTSARSGDASKETVASWFEGRPVTVVERLPSVGEEPSGRENKDGARHGAFNRAERALRRNTPESVAKAVAIGRRPASLPTADLIRLAGRFIVTGHPDVARDLVEAAERRDPAELEGGKQRRLDHLRAWTHPVAWPEPPADAIQVGVFHYRQPDRPRGSKNIGDYVQTLALLGNLARFSDVEFSGVDGLGELASDLQARVRPELRIRTEPRRVHLVPVSRDFSQGDPVDDGTWLPAFGWHLHTSFGLRYGLPYNAALRPLFFSFHLHALDALDEATLAYLRDNGPVGCRDWATVDVLLSAGVDAFFTGCVTTTVDAVFPALDSLDRSDARAVGVVDLEDPEGLPPGRPVERFENAQAVNRDLELVTGTRAAVELLETYQRRLERVVTSRLHAYLPATSLGLPVDFRPNVPGDARFTGLIGLTPDSPDFTAMRDGLRELLSDVFGRILAGASPEEVHDAWVKRAAPFVEAARARQQAPHPPYPPVRESAAVATSVSVGDVHVLVDPDNPLALPDLLRDVRRVVLLAGDDDRGAEDAAELADVDLDGRAVGAHLSDEPAALVWRRAADRLTPDAAGELRRVLNARHPFATRALAAGPIVLDLERMRADPSRAEAIALAAYFGLDGRESLLAYAGPEVTSLDG